MTTPPADDAAPNLQGSPAHPWTPTGEAAPVIEQPFDPYRFGAPEHPVPPEYAPPGYIPPPVTQAPVAVGQRQSYPNYAPQPGQYPYPSPPVYGPPPPWATQYPQPRTGNGKATAALVLGIVSVLFFWVSLLDAVPVVLAIIFGVIARSEAKRTGSARGAATTGLVLGIIGALLATVFTVWIYTRIKPCIDNYNSGSAEYNSCIHTRI